MALMLWGITPLVQAADARAQPASPADELDGSHDGLWSLSAQGMPEPVGVEAEAWILVDASTGQILADRNAEQVRPPASTTKLLTALAVARRSQPDELVTVSSNAASQSGASVGLFTGQQLRVDDLLALLLVRSGNDAAVALAEHTAGSEEAFAALLVQEATVLGLEGFVLLEPHGLADGNRLSARQLAVVGRAVLADDQLRPIVGAATWELSTGRVITNRNLLLAAYPSSTGLKTGMTRAAGWSLVASARRGARHLVAVVLGADSDRARVAAATTLLDHGFSEFAASPSPPSLRLRGDATWVDVTASRSVALLPPGTEVGFDPEIPVELHAPALRFSWAGEQGTIGSWVQATILRSGRTTVKLAPVGQLESDATAAGTPELGAWLSGRVQAGMRAATVAGLWDE